MRLFFSFLILLATAQTTIAQQAGDMWGFGSDPSQIEPSSGPQNHLANCLANPTDHEACTMAGSARTDGGLESAVRGGLEVVTIVVPRKPKTARRKKAAKKKPAIRVVKRVATPIAGKPKTSPPSLPVVDFTIAFDYDSAALKNGEQAKLTQLATALKHPINKDNRFAIIGHTDAKGKASYNCALSRRRAATVTNSLAGQGVPRASLMTFGAGEHILRNAADPRSAQNRRVGLARLTKQGAAVISQIARLCAD